MLLQLTDEVSSLGLVKHIIRSSMFKDSNGVHIYRSCAAVFPRVQVKSSNYVQRVVIIHLTIPTILG